MRLESIIITENSKNYNKIITALSYFDLVISGGMDVVMKKRITKKHTELSINLFDYFSDNNTGKIIQFDQYLISTFQNYIQQKKEMVFDYLILKGLVYKSNDERFDFA